MDVHELPHASAASFHSCEMEQLRRLEGLPKLLLTYSLSIIPEEQSFSGATVAQGNDQSYRILTTERNVENKGGEDELLEFLPAEECTDHTCLTPPSSLTCSRWSSPVSAREGCILPARGG